MLLYIAGVLIFICGYALCALMASGKMSDIQSDMIIDINQFKEREDRLKKELAEAVKEKKHLRDKLDYINMMYGSRLRRINARIDKELDTDNPNYMEAGL